MFILASLPKLLHQRPEKDRKRSDCFPAIYRTQLHIPRLLNNDRPRTACAANAFIHIHTTAGPDGYDQICPKENNPVRGELFERARIRPASTMIQ